MICVSFLSVIVMLEDRGCVSVVLKYDRVFVKGLMVGTSVVLLSKRDRKDQNISYFDRQTIHFIYKCIFPSIESVLVPVLYCMNKPP